jgi:hypothetical protein
MILQQLSLRSDFKLKNFRSFYPHNPTTTANSFIRNNCKSDHNSDFKDSVCWDKGSDYSVLDGEKIYKYTHPGIHFQHHISDFFHALYKENNPG